MDKYKQTWLFFHFEPKQIPYPVFSSLKKYINVAEKYFPTGSCHGKQLDLFGMASEDTQLTIRHSGVNGWAFMAIRLYTKKNHLEWLGNDFGEMLNNKQTVSFRHQSEKSSRNLSNQCTTCLSPTGSFAKLFGYFRSFCFL